MISDRHVFAVFAPYVSNVLMKSLALTCDFVSQISGQDKPSPNVPSTVTPTTNFSNKLRSPPVPINNIEISQNSMNISTPSRDSAYAVNYPSGDLFILFLCSICFFLRNSKCHFYIHTC